MYIKIPFAHLHSMSSDLLAGQVKIAFTLPLNDETMKLREQIAMLKIMEQAVALEIRSPLQPLPGMGATPPPSTFAAEFEKAATEIVRKHDAGGSVTFSAAGHEPVTLTDTQFSEHVKKVVREGRAKRLEARGTKFVDQAQLTRERKPRSKG